MTTNEFLKLLDLETKSFLEKNRNQDSILERTLFLLLYSNAEEIVGLLETDPTGFHLLETFQKGLLKDKEMNTAILLLLSKSELFWNSLTRLKLNTKLESLGLV